MKPRHIVLLAFLAAITFARAENFLMNPSFEEIDAVDTTRPRWWDRLCTLEGEEPLAFDDKMAFGGVRSLSLQTDAVKDDVLVIWRHPKLGTALHILPEGTEMKLSMRVLAEQKTRCASTSHPRKRSISSWRSHMGASSVAWCMT